MHDFTKPLEEESAIQQLNEATAHVAKAISNSRDLGFNSRKLSSLFSENQECVFLKDRSGRFIFTNESCKNFFSHQVTSPVGMKSSSLLPNSVREVSQLSDQLILAGCERLKFKHDLELHDEGPVKAITIKLPFFSEDNQKILGIIGLSQTLQPVGQRVNDAELQRLGLIVNAMREEEKQVARFVCDGISNKVIAKQLETPLRTIENRRRNILKKLGIDSTAELIKIMVRMEDAGLINLGV